MPVKKLNSVIALEIEKYEKKIAEFQNYLERVNFEYAEDKYKEADLHKNLMNALPTWILALKSMKEDSKQKKMELRGGEEINEVARFIGKTKND